MPLINVKVIEGVFTPEQKTQIAERLTDAIVSIEGESIRGVTWVVLEEAHSGDWGIGGKPLSTETSRRWPPGRPLRADRPLRCWSARAADCQRLSPTASRWGVPQVRSSMSSSSASPTTGAHPWSRTCWGQSRRGRQRRGQVGARGMGEISQPAGAEGEELLPADQREGPYSESSGS